MQKESRDVEIMEMVEAVQDAMRRVDRLVSEYAVRELESRTVHYLGRRGFGGERAERMIREVSVERKRLASSN